MRALRLALILSLLSAAVWAAETDSYVIGDGDILHILVYDEPDLERTVTVQPDGLIRFPLVRQLQVGGLSVQDAEQRLEEALGQKYLNDPQVTITVKEFHSKKVYVLGAVKNPGLYSLTGPSTVLEVISKAGGTTDNGDRQILLVRGDKQKQAEVKKFLEEKGATDAEAMREAGLQPPIVIDGHKLFDLGDTSQNQVLQDGDVIYVPQLTKVYVLGEVKRTGSIPYTEGLTLVQAVTLAGGVTEMASNTIYVTRKVNGKEVRIKAKFSAILGDTSKDILLQPADVIVVKRRIL